MKNANIERFSLADRFPAEAATIAAIIRNPSTLPTMTCRPSDFESRQLGAMFRAATTLADQADVLTIANHLDEHEPTEGGWLYHVGSVAEYAVATRNGTAYAAKVREQATQRGAVQIAENLRDTGDVNAAMRELMELTREEKSHAGTMAEASRQMLDAIDKAFNGERGIATGLSQFDSEFGGLMDGRLIVVGARPKMGKTAFMGTLALNAARKGHKVGIASAEQPMRELVQRLTAGDAGLSLHDLSRGNIDESAWAKLHTSIKRLNALPIEFYDRPGMTIDDVIAQARRWHYRGALDMLLVDYIQLLRHDAESEMRLKVGAIVAGLKALAIELDVPVVALSQVKRAVEDRKVNANGEGREPYPADLAESAIIENTADQIITLCRPEVYLPHDSVPAHIDGLAKIVMCANRHGPNGTAYATFNARTLQYHDRRTA